MTTDTLPMSYINVPNDAMNFIPETCAIGCQWCMSVQRRNVAGPPCHACFVGRSATSGQAVMKSMPPILLNMVLAGPGGVWHGAEGICGDAGECSSDGHASHPVSVDHS